MATVVDRRPDRETIYPLENGDHLDRAEFERRYAAMPHATKAELIEGIVYMASPVSIRRHGLPHAVIIGWLVAYRGSTPGVLVADNASDRLDPDNMPQPDAMLLIDPERGGQARISADDYVEGAPELVVEVSSSTASIDLNLKLPVYLRNGVREYIVWRVRDREVDWFVQERGEFVRLALEDGIYRSRTFPGLWLDVPALLKDDVARVLDTVRQGTATPEHAAFRARLGP